jgi:hypothetical protein
MRGLKRLWRAIEDVSTLAALDAEWRELAGQDYDQMKPFLQPSREYADSYPNPQGGLPLRVVEHGPADIVGVCPDSGETYPLQKKQLLVYHLGAQRLALQIASTLGLAMAQPVEQNNPRFFTLGSLSHAGATFAVFLILPHKSSDTLIATSTIIGTGQLPFLLLLPSHRFLSGEVAMRLRALGSGVLPLDESLIVAEDGRWCIREEAIPVAMPTPVLAEETLDEREKVILMAMLELHAFDSDSRKTTQEIAGRAFGANVAYETLKSVIRTLKERQLIMTVPIKGGGCYLTTSGKRRAEKLSHRQ